MNIKEFMVGETIYILTLNKGRNVEPTTRESKVKSVGRKYVTTQNDSRYQECEYLTNGLVEDKEWGERDYIFKTKLDAEEYIEKLNLETWLNNVTRRIRNNFTLEQLRKVKEILGD